MSKMGSSIRAHRIQQLAESPFTLLCKAPIPFAVTSVSTLLDTIDGFCAYHAMFYTQIACAMAGTTEPPIMDLQLVFNQ